MKHCDGMPEKAKTLIYAGHPNRYKN